jgi:predicted anti-sigma-YlaC factor YlaD
MKLALKQQRCEANLIAAFVDGELTRDEALLFEEHLKQCDDCRSELRAHQLFICELDAVLTDKEDVAVPTDFSRVVAARATSDMSGVRSRSEHRKALLFVVILGSIAFVLLGANASRAAIFIVERFIGKTWSIITFVWGASYDALASIVVISRVVSKKFVVESRSLSLMLVLLAAGIFTLSRLISRYHRTGATE